MQSINSDYDKVAKSDGELVRTYTELLERIADLSYDYPKSILYFRGQSKDYTTHDGRTTIYPSIYRGTLSKDELKEKFRILDGSARALVYVSKKYNLKGISEMRKRKQILWSVLQHYEICDTPLLDITHSLRTACSFALGNNKQFGYLYVLAMPYLTNRITYNSEEDLILVRLLSISPPAAKRPFYQEGYVVGTPDVTDDYERKTELDVVNRLIAKFKIENSDEFWGRDFSPLSNEYIYPEEDQFRKIKDEVIELKNRGFYDNTIGDFLKLWNQLEKNIKKYAKTNEYSSLLSSYNKLFDINPVYKKYSSIFNDIRLFRNGIVHGSKEVSEEVIDEYIQKLKNLMETIENNR